ncbi:hypothetical protein K437DRAFT_255966 [Tilletiaria anomala UBC 951]|uniref:Pyoverdine/dityrosine biosynthesis protein n=1 Tax=Tilletiaria anomala (strain ATCC 24038 / CBS 436.72 / UBC 951) TaxID=1037660 RepID=A0A066W097_TILAU|nr:uncharacterized protein K437DRAFT_255966 [Tilletiaria anomala UBC 951]KDN47171.1 hypothetical protein K437DRAFT_255966 [Tilletiaria anomala UBC 951]
MTSLNRLTSAALLETPVKVLRTASAPHHEVLGTYICDHNGHVQESFGRLAPTAAAQICLNRGVRLSFEPHSLPSYANILTNWGFNAYFDKFDDGNIAELLTLFPCSNVVFLPLGPTQPAMQSVCLLEMSVGDRIIGVAITQADYLGEALSISTNHVPWRCLHPRADVRLCALFTLQGATKSLSNGPPLLRSAIDVDSIVEQVVVNFEQSLKHTPAVDHWDDFSDSHDTAGVGALQGRRRFAATVRNFVVKGQPIPFVLPAFPCKSSNKDKISGHLPDKGEDLAAQTLCLFARGVQDVYLPGAIIHIVSDGHTFSDLIGVDDAVVDEYTAALKLIFKRHDPTGSIFRFHGLDDLLYTSPFGIETRHGFQGTALPDLMRLALSALWGPENMSQMDASILKQCQGLSRFLLKDLEQVDSLQHLSKSQRKRHAMEAAKVMVARNEAYSKLVEISFPAAVRLSIHPHNNSGPKYGVTLIHPNFRSSSLFGKGGDLISDQSMGHTPTPWHNVTLLVEVEEKGSPRFAFMHRTKLMDHQPSPAHHLVWVPMRWDESEEGATGLSDGGYFCFQRAEV